MQTFEWSLPTRVVFGAGTFDSVGKLVKGMGKRAFIVTSRSFAKGGTRQSLLESLVKQLKDRSIEVNVNSGIPANPTVESVDIAANEAREFRPGFIIALGGGSVMDAAKCVALLQKNEGGIWQYAYKGPGQLMQKFNSATPLVCVPTIAATGSESNTYAVVTHSESKTKSTVFGPALQPTLSVIDPALTLSVSPEGSIDGAIDIIAHAMETYLSTKAPRMLTVAADRLTEAVVSTVVDALPRVLKNPNDIEARGQISWAATLPLSGLLNGRTGGFPIHALEHGLTVATGCSHGRGLAMLLPRVMDFDSAVIGEKIADFNRRVFQREGYTLSQFMKEVGAWTTWQTLGVSPGEVERRIDEVLEHTYRVDAVLRRDEPEPFLENVKPIKLADARHILLNCRS